MGFLSSITGGDWLGAGSSLIGGLIGRKGSNKDRTANNANMAADRAQQREFAKMGVRWKVQDAKAAGLHPLAALGISTSSSSPVSIGQNTPNHMGKALSDMGQDLSRSMTAKQTAAERAPYNALMSENLRLQNDKLIAETAAISNPIRNQSQMPPPMPTGSTGTNNVEELPATTISRGTPTTQAGIGTSTKFHRTKTGFQVLMSDRGKEAMEEDLAASIPYQVKRFYSPEQPNWHDFKREFPNAKGMKYNRWVNEWQPIYKYSTHHKNRTSNMRPYYKSKRSGGSFTSGRAPRR